MKTILFIIFSAAISYSCYSQVGVGTNTVHESAMLQVESETKGTLITSVTSRFVVESNCTQVAEGLLIYDESESAFFTYSQGQWHKLNPWKSTSEQNIQYDQKVGIGTNPDNSNESLQVNGQIKTTGSITVENTGTINGYGSIPLGGIILWSGTIPPDGWALCDGTTVNGIKSPDLRGRFIVGYNPTNNDYLQPGNLSQGGIAAGQIGGQASVSLAKYQLPQHIHGKGTLALTGTGEHSHNYVYDYSKVNNNGSEAVIAKNNTTGHVSVTINYTGGGHTHGISGTTENGYADGLSGQSHENRPPYYVLAFIIRVK
ncbi:MAG: tail fiber protein [Bacteroidales bacterium]|nr:tail fiber protein [Bacteroidales bacterium]